MLEFVGVVFLVVIALVVAFFIWLYTKFGSSFRKQAYVAAIGKEAR
tara:strand:+ start:15213 stop:15350 length:138 start_codon:yes stop_codon:yes gene_type:complete